MVAIVRKVINSQKTLNEILQIVSVNIFEQVPLSQLLAVSPETWTPETETCEAQKLLSLNGL